MATDEQRAAAQSLHKLGSEIVTAAGKMTIANELAGLGRQLRRLRPDDLGDEKLVTLRRPLDGFRAAADKLEAITLELRNVADILASVIGIDN